VLDVKPAFEDVDAQIFLAFHCAIVEDRIESNTPKKKPRRTGAKVSLQKPRERKQMATACTFTEI